MGREMKPWQTTVLRYVSIAFGIAVGVTLTLAALIWFWNRPKSWDTKSITSVSAEAVPFDSDVNAGNFHTDGFFLRFTLLNNTGTDYTVPTDIKLLERRKDTGALEEFGGKVSQPVLVPSHERAQLTVALDYSCRVFLADGTRGSDRDDPNCFQDAFGEMSGFVLLDSESKVRLDLPVPQLRTSSH
jgi:hypothetical protein